jgi:hypothetical protein
MLRGCRKVFGIQKASVSGGSTMLKGNAHCAMNEKKK